MYVDFKKAFDSHTKLLLKLQIYGICGDLLGWITSFLSIRTQSVNILDALSSVIVVRSGVPQGSVLGPILFLLYVNNIVDIFFLVFQCLVSFMLMTSSSILVTV